MEGKSHSRGHPIVWDKKTEKWLYEDNMKPIYGHGGENRPCVKCNKLFEGSNIGESDPCLQNLPGVDNACCGHGVKEESYVRFTSGVVLTGFDVEYTRLFRTK